MPKTQIAKRRWQGSMQPVSLWLSALVVLLPAFQYLDTYANTPWIATNINSTDKYIYIFLHIMYIYIYVLFQVRNVFHLCHGPSFCWLYHNNRRQIVINPIVMTWLQNYSKIPQNMNMLKKKRKGSENGKKIHQFEASPRSLGQLRCSLAKLCFLPWALHLWWLRLVGW